MLYLCVDSKRLFFTATFGSSLAINQVGPVVTCGLVGLYMNIYVKTPGLLFLSFFSLFFFPAILFTIHIRIAYMVIWWTWVFVGHVLMDDPARWWPGSCTCQHAYKIPCWHVTAKVVLRLLYLPNLLYCKIRTGALNRKIKGEIWVENLYCLLQTCTSHR